MVMGKQGTLKKSVDRIIVCFNGVTKSQEVLVGDM